MDKRKLVLYAAALLCVLIASVLNAHILLVVVLGLVLSSEFVNGWTDAPNAIATLIATRVMTPRQAIIMAACFNVAGTFAGTAVAETLGKEIVDPSSVNLLTIGAALVGVVVWGAVAAQFGIPTSESHALVAGLSGAAIATSGFGALRWQGWGKVLIGIPSALLLGFVVTWLVSKGILLLARNMTPSRGKKTFDLLQVFSGASMALAHGMNDGQKFMGVFSLALVMGGVFQYFHIPWWVRGLCALVMGIGTSIGGEKIIGTLGEKIAKLESWQGFSALTGSTATVILASAVGAPISTTHTIVAAVAGTGASRFPAMVRWQYPREILYAALFTFPLCAGIAYVICMAFRAVQSVVHLFV